jgi:hypothetical protein
MSKFLRIGARFSRDVFFCLGGIALLMLVVPIILPMVNSNVLPVDWSGDFLLYVIAAAGALTFLACAYGLRYGKRWGPPFAAFVSLSMLLLILSAWASEGFAMPAVVAGAPMLATFFLCTAETLQRLSRRSVLGEG